MIYISKIVLKNFKSFKKAVMPIKQGFTAIVGPNGSGKSNIVDAICFVLGKSSARSLRAERFADLIFNGGKKDKPAEEAEVTIYFDNAGRELPIESREVKISRSIDRSGNSVYRINGKRASRAEVLELLSEARIYPDGHNIISQGDVTKIIEMNPIERRQIIDEISGILEYDERKRKALRELEKVSGNISKVEAVLNEIEEQLNRLKKDRDDAIRYKNLKGELKKYKFLILEYKRKKIEEKIKKIKNILEEEKNKKKKIEKLKEILDLKLKIRKGEIDNLNREIISIEETKQFSLLRNFEKIKNEIKFIESEILNKNSRLKEIEKLILEQKNELVAISKEIKRMEYKNSHLLAIRDKLNERIEILKLEIDKYHKKISKDPGNIEYRRNLAELGEKISKIYKEIVKKERELASLSFEKSETEKKIENLRRELKKFKIKNNEISGKIKEIEEKIENIKSNDELISHDKRDIESKIEEIKENLMDISLRLQLYKEEEGKLKAQCKFLERKIYEKSVEEILKLGIPGVYGTISQLGVSNEKFSKALEVAAGAGINFIVVEDDKVAEKCIEYLKKNKIGRATFLPLKNLKTKKPPKEAIEIAKRTYGFAFELIEFDSKFKPAFYEVFRDTIVVEDIEEARKMGIGKCRMVTLDGELLEKSGRISGGHFKPRRFEFAESKRKLVKIENEIRKIIEKRKKLLSIEKDLEARLKSINDDEIKIKNELEINLELLKIKKEEKNKIKENIVNIEVELSKLKLNIEKIEKEINSKESELLKLKQNLNSLEKEKKKLEEKLQGSDIEEILNNIKRLEEKIKRLEKEKVELDNKIKLNNSKISEILKIKMEKTKDDLLFNFKQKKKILKEIEKLQNELEKIKNRYNKIKKEKDVVKEKITKLKSKRDRFISGISKIEKKISQMNKLRENLSKKIERKKIETAKLEIKLEEILKELGNFEGVHVEIEKPFDPKTLEEKIIKLEMEIKNLEPVNMRAIKDFEIVKERYEGIKSKIQKLQEEKNAILKLMEEIEHRKKEIFMKVFDNISKNFKYVFSRLSGGGEAELILDEKNPLEGGLQIKAKPPGKNLQYIELLSGGEKTLTALSFIFAIQRYQSAPFYVMDEIDMFLDDTNIRKVSELIKESSKEAQFIVVSLRESLMTSADHLYGVVNEDGVSKIIGVELKEIGRVSSN